jgi:hypothetical protein
MKISLSTEKWSVLAVEIWAQLGRKIPFLEAKIRLLQG